MHSAEKDTCSTGSGRGAKDGQKEQQREKEKPRRKTNSGNDRAENQKQNSSFCTEIRIADAGRRESQDF